MTDSTLPGHSPQENRKLRSQEYSELLEDNPYWRMIHDAVIQRAGSECEVCGSPYRLQAHHTYYKYGLKPWEYPLSSLQCLCRCCHYDAHSSDRRPERDEPRHISHGLTLAMQKLIDQYTPAA
jgi:5-methylcytosine-specific restriction endonuclease McrA